MIQLTLRNEFSGFFTTNTIRLRIDIHSWSFLLDTLQANSWFAEIHQIVWSELEVFDAQELNWLKIQN